MGPPPTHSFLHDAQLHPDENDLVNCLEAHGTAVCA